MKFIIIMTIALALPLSTIIQSAESSSDKTPLKAVEHVDLSRYAGVWHDIAHYPNKYQDGCLNSTATFSLRKDGEIDVLNSCRDKKDGTLHHANGRGWAIDTSSNARLKFSFFWPFRSEYWIIDQGKDYEYAVIGSPDRKRLWIIARTAVVSSEVFENILQNIEKQGFQRDKLTKTDHGTYPSTDPEARTKEPSKTTSSVNTIH